jgi:transposase
MLAVPVSRSTLVRMIRRIPETAVVTPRVLGVDDFAKRRGHRYATILIDMDTHTPIDVLDDRSAETLAQWLIAHPGVEIVCRDRGGSYADGVNRGAPGAIQVADRWHLLHNLSGAVDKVVSRHRRCLKRPATTPKAPTSAPTPQRPSSGRRAANTRHRHAQVAELREQGMPLRAIARALDMNVHTVRKYARAETAEALIPPNRTRGYRPLDAFKPYLQTRYDEGITVTAALFAEITARGYRGSLRTVREFLATIRADTPPPATIPTTRQITAWIMRPDEKLSDEDKLAFKDALVCCDDLSTLTSYAHGFTALVRNLDGANLPAWITHASQSPFPEIRSFANGLLNDLDAVTNGLTLTWSSGAVEGHVNRIKTIKRQMYGRANLDLLRRRILIRT